MARLFERGKSEVSKSYIWIVFILVYFVSQLLSQISRMLYNKEAKTLMSCRLNVSFLSKEITEKLETECLLGSLTLRKRRKYANFHPVVVYARAVKVTAIACPFYHIVLFITLHSV